MSAHYARRPDVAAVRAGDEVVMMDVAAGEYYGLRDVAASLWDHLAEPRTLDELCALVADEYDTTPERCRDDVRAFLDDLVGRELVSAG